MGHDRWTAEELIRLAAGGVRKIDQMGPDGVPHCSPEEIEAMAGLILATRALEAQPPTPAEPLVFRSVRSLQ